MMQKLYNVKNGSRIKVVRDNQHPPAHRNFAIGEELEFYHIDGMYSYCKDDDGNIVHLACYAKVEVMREGPV